MRKSCVLAAVAALALLSCSKETGTDTPVATSPGSVTISASFAESKTVLGPKEGTTYPNYWSSGDKISVNGVTSSAIDDSFAGTSKADFEVAGVSAPYFAACPAAAVSGYDAGSASVTIPASQDYVADSYDPAAFVLLAKSDNESITFAPAVAMFKLTVGGGSGLSIKTVTLSAIDTDMIISGDFSTDFESLTAKPGGSNSVGIDCGTGVPAGSSFFFAFAPADFSADGLKIEITDVSGNSMVRTAKPSKPYVAGKVYAASIDWEVPGLVLENSFSSSSTLAFTWGYGTDGAADAAKAYEFTLFSDVACTQPVVGFTTEAGAECWNGKQPKFVFAGLTPATTYWCKVTDTDSGIESEVVSATTKEFTVVDITTLTGAAAGDVILAEDFSEIGWGADEFDGAAGFEPTTKTLAPLSGILGSSDGDFRICNANKTRLFEITTLADSDRLSKWGFHGNSAVYAYAGYLRVASTSSGARTHIVTPSLDCIPDGKKATLDVTITSLLKDDSENDVAVFVENGLSATALEKGGYKFKDASFASGVPAEALYLEWSTKTVRVSGVVKGSHLVIGSYKNIDTKNRFCLSDVKVQVVELKDASAVDATLTVSDFASFKDFLNASRPGSVVEATVTANVALSDTEEAEIASLYPIADFNGKINGGGYTISGLKKPLFNVLEGNVSNLTVNSTVSISDAQANAGIFACTVAPGAELSDCVSEGSIDLAFGDTVGGDISLGGFAGTVSGATLTNCVNNASVTNSTDSETHIFIGGIAGESGDGTTYVACSNTGAVSNSGASGIKTANQKWDAADFGVRIAGLVGSASGVNTFSGTSTAYNHNDGAVTESSSSKYVAVAGICGWANNASTAFAYCRNNAQGDILIENNERIDVAVGGILAVAKGCAIDVGYTRNYGDIRFKRLSFPSTGANQGIYAGGILGANTVAPDETFVISHCYNEGVIGNYTEGWTSPDLITAYKSIGYSYVGGIAGATDKAYYKYEYCYSTGDIRIWSNLKMRIGGIAGYSNKAPENCAVYGDVYGYRQYNSSGKKPADVATITTSTGNDVGGIIGYCNIAGPFTNLTYYGGTVITRGGSPGAYIGGIVGDCRQSTSFVNCNVAGTVSGAGSSGSFAGLFLATNAETYTVSFTSCRVNTGTTWVGSKSTTVTSLDAENLIGYKSGTIDSTNNDVTIGTVVNPLASGCPFD